MPPGLGGPPPLFLMFFILFGVLFAGFFLVAIGKGIATWSRNNASPLLSEQAHVVSKRTEVWGGSGDSTANTRYYVTFENSSADRIELQVNGHTFGLLVEGDHGTLAFQGTRYLDFVRSKW